MTDAGPSTFLAIFMYCGCTLTRTPMVRRKTKPENDSIAQASAPVIASRATVRPSDSPRNQAIHRHVQVVLEPMADAGGEQESGEERRDRQSTTAGRGSLSGGARNAGRAEVPDAL